MATKGTQFSVNNNSAEMKENMRKLISFNNKKLFAYKTVGEMDGEQLGREYIADYNKPTLTTNADLKGVVAESSVSTKVESADLVVNYMTNTVIRTEVAFAAGNDNAVGNLGDLTVQEEQLLLRFMEIVDTLLISNTASVKPAGVTAGTAGSPATFAHADQFVNVGTAGTFTAAGYNASSETTTAIDDNVTTRGNIGFDDISEAAQKVFEAHNGATGNSDQPTLTETNLIAYLPSGVWNAIFKDNGNSIITQNRFNARIGGENSKVMADVRLLETTWGNIALFPAVNQVGDDASANKFGIVMGNKATEVIYNERPYIHKLYSKATADESALRANWTVRGPQQNSISVIAGVNQS